MSRIALSEIVSIGSDIAGVLALFLSVFLGILTWSEHRDSIDPVLRLGALHGNPDVPFGDAPQDNANLAPSVMFPIHHDRGPDVSIQTVSLRLAARKDTSPGWRIGGGFGRDGIFEVSDDAIQLYCWQLGKDGAIVSMEERSLPFARGATRYYSLPAAGLLTATHLQRRGSRHFATLQVWSQGRVIGEYDVSEFVREAQKQMGEKGTAEQGAEGDAVNRAP